MIDRSFVDWILDNCKTEVKAGDINSIYKKFLEYRKTKSSLWESDSNIVTYILLECGYSPEEIVEQCGYIYPYMFNNLNIQSITIDRVVKIPENTFSHCHKLETVRIKEGIEVIDKLAFSNCQQLKEVYIPSTIKKVGDMAFLNCKDASFYINMPRADFLFGNKMGLDVFSPLKSDMKLYFFKNGIPQD